MRSYDRLVAAGFSDEQARAIVEGMAGDLVTRDYLDGRLTLLRGDLDGRLTMLKSDLDARLAEFKVDLTWRMLGIVAPLYLGMAGIVGLLIPHLR